MNGRLGGPGGLVIGQDLGGDRALFTGATLTAPVVAPAAEVVFTGPLINGLDEWCGYDAILGQSASCAEGLTCINALCIVLDFDALSDPSQRSGDVFHAGSDPFVTLGHTLTVEEMEAKMAE